MASLDPQYSQAEHELEPSSEPQDVEDLEVPSLGSEDEASSEPEDSEEASMAR